MSITSVHIVLVILDRLEPLNTGESSRARGWLQARLTAHITNAAHKSHALGSALGHAPTTRVLAARLRSRIATARAACVAVHTLRHSYATMTCIMDHRSRQRACVHRQHPTRPRRQPIRSRTCTDFDMWTCLVCTDFDRSARCSSAQLDMAAELLSSLGSALFSLLCSGSALFATARGSSTRASAASLGLRLCLARVALFGLTGSAHDFRLSLARVTNRLGPRLLS